MKHRTWFSLLSYSILLALGTALVFAIVVAGGSVALASHQSAVTQETSDPASQVAPDIAPTAPASQGSKFTGMITDSRCGARHMRKSRLSSEECARFCYRQGASYMLVDGDHRYTLIGSEEAVGKLLGQRATVSGKQQDDAIIVDSAVPSL